MKQKHKYPRSSGVLLPITALHGPFGVGVLGAEALEFIDFLSECGFHTWQVLPVENTGGCFSPYKCISTYAGEPMLIDPRMLEEMGLVYDHEVEERKWGVSEESVNFELVRERQWAILRKGYSRLEGAPYAEFNPPWLDNYALYMALRHRYEDVPWYDWPDDDARSYDGETIRRAREDLAGEIKFYKFVQWLFDKQWKIVRDYAAERDITMFGDLPIYVSEDSVDVWSNRKLFDADANGNFLAVGGAPPDYFNPDGQLWGNPIYNWELLKSDGYKWWIDRMKGALGRYDVIRLDHFRGFESYWNIPATALTAREGEWVKGPGAAFFDALRKELGDLPVIAEDLGDVDDDVINLLEKSGFRGMRVLQFGLLGGDNSDDMHLPHSFSEGCIAYTGTHDNTTLLDCIFHLPWEERDRALRYIGFDGDWTVGGPNCDINRVWIRALFMSGASIVVIPIQDLLGYGGDTRTNTPGTPEGNWRFRIRSGVLEEIDAAFYADINKLYERDNAVLPVSEDGAKGKGETPDEPEEPEAADKAVIGKPRKRKKQP